MNNQQPINVTIDKTYPLECSNCKNATFVSGYMFRMVPKLLVGAKEDQPQEVKVLICDNCRKVYTGFLSDILVKQMEKEKNTPHITKSLSLK